MKIQLLFIFFLLLYSRKCIGFNNINNNNNNNNNNNIYNQNNNLSLDSRRNSESDNNNNIVFDIPVFKLKPDLDCLEEETGCNLNESENWISNKLPTLNSSVEITDIGDSSVVYLVNASLPRLYSLTLNGPFSFRLVNSNLTSEIIKMNNTELTVQRGDLSVSNFIISGGSFRTNSSNISVKTQIKVTGTDFEMVNTIGRFKTAINFLDTKPIFRWGSYIMDSTQLVQCNFFQGLQETSTLYPLDEQYSITMRNCHIWADSQIDRLKIYDELMVSSSILTINRELRISDNSDSNNNTDGGSSSSSSDNENENNRSNIGLSLSTLIYSSTSKNVSLTNLTLDSSKASFHCAMVNLSHVNADMSSSIEIIGAHDIIIVDTIVNKLSLIEEPVTMNMNLTNININMFTHSNSVTEPRFMGEVTRDTELLLLLQQQQQLQLQKYSNIIFKGESSRINQSIVMTNAIFTIEEGLTLELGGPSVYLGGNNSGIYLYGKLLFNGTLRTGPQGIFLLSSGSSLSMPNYNQNNNTNDNSLYTVDGSINVQNGGSISLASRVKITGNLLLDNGDLQFTADSASIYIEGSFAMGWKSNMHFNISDHDILPSQMVVINDVYLNGTLSTMLSNTTKKAQYYLLETRNGTISNGFTNNDIDFSDNLLKQKGKVLINSTFVIVELYDGFDPSNFPVWKILLIVLSGVFLVLFSTSVIYIKRKIIISKISKQNRKKYFVELDNDLLADDDEQEFIMKESPSYSNNKAQKDSQDDDEVINQEDDDDNDDSKIVKKKTNSNNKKKNTDFFYMIKDLLVKRKSPLEMDTIPKNSSDI